MLNCVRVIDGISLRATAMHWMEEFDFERFWWFALAVFYAVCFGGEHTDLYQNLAVILDFTELVGQKHMYM